MPVMPMLRSFCLALLVGGSATLAACGGDEPESSAECGNSLIESGESCDDGNVGQGDGCSAACVLESGWVCVLEGFACSTQCGDNVTAGTETCDDGNASDGDGCSATCQEEGPGLVEVCDDGADNDDDGAIDCDDADCSDACELDEICDDGLDNDGDSLTDCDDDACATAQNCISRDENCSEPGDEDGNELADCDDPACTCSCGDGTINGSEQCDDGSENDDTLPNACRTSCSLPSCGDGVVDSGELCDGAEPPVGFVCESCLLVPTPVCGETASLASWSISNASADDLRRQFVLDSSRADDVPVPTDCAPVQGADSIIPISFVDGGVYRFTLTTPSPSTRVSALFSGSCDFAAAPCERASTGFPGALVVSASIGESAYLALDSGTQASVTVDVVVERFDRVVTEGTVCDPASTVEVCATGLSCVADETGNALCTRARTLSGQGGICSETDDCFTGLECRDATCQPYAGTTCETPVPFDDIRLDEVVEVSLSPGLGTVAGTCGGFPLVSLFEIADDGFFTVTATSELGLPIAVSVREVCGLAVTETGCSLGREGAQASLGFEVPPAGARTVVVESFGNVELEVQRVPVRGSGQRCDVTGVADRCASGLSCAGGTCEPALAGSCADPAPAFLAGSGDLTGRGLVIQVEPSTVTSAVIPGCIGPVRTQVFTLTAPVTGRLVAGVLLDSPGVTVNVTQSCQLESGIETFCNPERGNADVLNVRAGQDVQLMVSTLTSDEVLVNLQLQPTSPEFGPCADTTGCEDGLGCAGGTCVRRNVPLEAACSLLTDRCPVEAVCAPDGTQLRCLSNPASNGQICETLAGLPACSEGLICEPGAGPTNVCGEPGGAIGTACDNDDECESRFVCLSRECWPEPGAAGGECLPASPQPCTTGLDCVASGVGAICIADATTPCTSDRDCTRPSVCFEEECRAPLSVGQPCGASTPPCGTGLECADSGLCERQLAGVDEFCAANADCRSGLFCRIGGGATDGLCAEPRNAGEICILGADPAQCVAPLVCESDASSIPRCTALP